MKKTIAFCILMYCAAIIYAEDIKVPDLETRIKNTGSSIPESALPALKPPVPSALPEAGKTPPIKIEVVPAEKIIESTPVVVPEEAVPEFTNAIKPYVFGYVEFGAGSPGILYGDISLTRPSSLLPGFDIGARYDSSDGYGYKNTGTGFFDRKTLLDMRVFEDRKDTSWFASISLLDRTDGIKGNDFDPSQTHRNILWDSELTSPLFATPGFSLSFDFGGEVFSSTASSTGIYNGYFLSPGIALAYSSGSFSSEISGHYGYETVSEVGEIHNGTGILALRYTGWGIAGEASGGIFADSSDGLMFPFKASLARENPVSPLRNLYVSGGLSVLESSPLLLSLEEPFASLDALPVFTSDWNISGGLTVSPFSFLSLSAMTEFKRTAFDRGIFVLGKSRAPLTGLLPVSRVNRDSLVTKASAVFSFPGTEISAGYAGEWADRLNDKSLHTADTGLRFFDKGADRVWEASADSSFSLEKWEYPVLGMKGTVSPVKDLSFSLSVNDLFYRAELILSARIDF